MYPLIITSQAPQCVIGTARPARQRFRPFLACGAVRNCSGGGTSGVAVKEAISIFCRSMCSSPIGDRNRQQYYLWWCTNVETRTRVRRRHDAVVVAYIYLADGAGEMFHLRYRIECVAYGDTDTPSTIERAAQHSIACVNSINQPICNLKQTIQFSFAHFLSLYLSLAFC